MYFNLKKKDLSYAFREITIHQLVLLLIPQHLTAINNHSGIHSQQITYLFIIPLKSIPMILGEFFIFQME